MTPTVTIPLRLRLRAAAGCTAPPVRVGALDASSSDDVWAVGTRIPPEPSNQIAAMH
ncbi:hypothetical protein [Streptomyces sp. LUP30]|uniref:hypothetical protein n=1 Tax=Streptomyces sp. LUP30 TaxID=1890285 RepID=UPI00159F2871|nr:hypothetical protein [Streptomyces sp. LUP30]